MTVWHDTPPPEGMDDEFVWVTRAREMSHIPRTAEFVRRWWGNPYTHWAECPKPDPPTVERQWCVRWRDGTVGSYRGESDARDDAEKYDARVGWWEGDQWVDADPVSPSAERDETRNADPWETVGWHDLALLEDGHARPVVFKYTGGAPGHEPEIRTWRTDDYFYDRVAWCPWDTLIASIERGT